MDTSVFIAVEAGRALAVTAPMDEGAVSFVTVGELRAGVLTPDHSDARSTRLTTLERALSMAPLAVDATVAASWAQLRSALRQSRRRVPVNDSWIATSALAHGLPVVTRDDDYDSVPGLQVIKV